MAAGVLLGLSVLKPDRPSDLVTAPERDRVTHIYASSLVSCGGDFVDNVRRFYPDEPMADRLEPFWEE